MTRPSIFDALLDSTLDETVVTSLEAWWPLHLAIGAGARSSLDHAVLAGLAADRMAWAFASGYRAALGRLVPSLDAEVMASLCVTEETGNTPRALATRLSPHDAGGFTLHGEKRWTTLGPRATVLLVAARVDAGDASRPELRLVKLDPAAHGVTITQMPEAPFVPEIPHASVSFAEVRVAREAILEGDGYDRYIKPFRTIEDIHVFGAALGHTVREIRLRGSRAMHAPLLEEALSVISSLGSVAEADASSPATHIALAGVLVAGRRVLAGLEQILSGDDERAVRWRRDRTVLSVAGSARAKRLERAWESMGQAFA